jgi:hypothetical protein
MDDAFWAERLEKAKQLLTAYDAAILAVASGAQSYQLDTGQTRTLVSKANLKNIIAARDALINEVASMEARVCGAGTHVLPGF